MDRHQRRPRARLSILAGDAPYVSANAGADQPIGQNRLCQDLVVPEDLDTLQLAFNLVTFEDLGWAGSSST